MPTVRTPQEWHKDLSKKILCSKSLIGRRIGDVNSTARPMAVARKVKMQNDDPGCQTAKNGSCGDARPRTRHVKERTGTDADEVCIGHQERPERDVQEVTEVYGIHDAFRQVQRRQQVEPTTQDAAIVT